MLYRELVGSLTYIANMTPSDIACIVELISRFIYGENQEGELDCCELRIELPFWDFQLRNIIIKRSQE